jgi:alpha-beta hydrolase superfamily lysophospholipase
MFDGLDNCKEMSVLFAGLELSFRGFHVLAIDGPGQGEALRLRNLTSRFDSEAAGTPAYDYVASRRDVDSERIGVMAYSAGGYYAPRMAAFENRYAALVAWGAHYDYHAVWQKRWEVMQANSKNSATSHFQLPWVLGVDGMEAALEKLKSFTLAGVAHQITCPILICHGEDDTLSPPEVARQLFENVGSVDKTLRIFTARDGGSTHVQVDNRQVGIDYIADWLETRLKPKRNPPFGQF